jgi:hypothetical protein
MFSFHFTFKSYLKTFLVRNKILSTLPIWAKIVIGATVLVVAATVIIVPLVYTNLEGQSFNIHSRHKIIFEISFFWN